MFHKYFYLFSLLALLLVLLPSVAKTQDKLQQLSDKLSENLDNKDKAQENFELIQTIYDLCYYSQPSQAIEKSAIAIALSSNMPDSTQRKALWLTKMGDIHLTAKNYSFAMRNYSEAYEIYDKLGDIRNTAYSLINIGSTFVSQLDYAFKYYKRADSLLSQINDTFGIITLKYKTGYCKFLNDETDTAIILLKEAIAMSDKANIIELSANSNYFLAKVFVEYQYPDSAIKFFNTALTYFVKNKDIYNSAMTYYELALIYMYQKNVPEAELKFNSAYKLFDDLNVITWLANINNKLAELYFYQKQYPKAKEYALSTIKLSNETIENFEPQKRDAYYMLSEIYRVQNNTESAYEYLMLYTQINNQIHEAEIQKRQNELQASLETENIEKEIEILKKEDALKEQELRAKQIQAYGFIAVALLFIVLAIYYFYTSRKEKRTNNILSVKNSEIVLQKKEIESQSKILEKANRAIMKQKDEIEKKTIKITHSINYASRIQQAMLSNIYVLKDHFEDHFVLFKPKEAVSGDFYWFSVVKDEQIPSLFKKKTNGENSTKVIVAVVDCTGHGVPGAFMSMLGDAYLNQIVNIQKITDSDVILSELHKAIRTTLQQRENENNDGMDVALCVVDKTKKELYFSGAKSPLIYIQNGELNRINGDLMSIGGLQKERVRHFQKYVVDVSVPTYCYIFSDGYQDQFGGKYGRKFMAKPFRDILEDNYSKSFDEQHKNLLQNLKKWQGKYPQMDDITVVGFKV